MTKIKNILFYLCISIIIFSCNQNNTNQKVEKQEVEHKTENKEKSKTENKEKSKTENKEHSIEKKEAKDDTKNTPKEKHEKLRILHWGAWEASLLPLTQSGVKRGGSIYLAAQIKERTTPNTIICSTGDLFPGDKNDKRPVVKVLESMGLQVSALGNLELNYGSKEIKKKLKGVNFSILSANVYQEGKRLFLPYIIKEIGKNKIGIIGLTSTEAATQVVPSAIEGITFKKPTTEVKKCLEELRGKVDFIIVLSNLRDEEDKLLAKNCPAINLIIGRYDVRPENKISKVGNILISRINKKQGLELIEINFTKKQGKWIYTSDNEYQISPDLSPDLKTKKIVEAWQKKEKKLARIICKTKVALEGEYQKVRQKETNFGNLLADILLESRPNADIAVLNSGCIRASIPKGFITKGMLVTALPYKNKVVELLVTGEIIKEMLENAVARYEKISGAFLQVAGLRFSFNPKKKKFSRVSNIKIQGEPIEPEKEYKLVTLNYIAGGGDDYVMLKNQKITFQSTVILQDLVEKYMEQRRNIEVGLENRITIEK